MLDAGSELFYTMYLIGKYRRSPTLRTKSPCEGHQLPCAMNNSTRHINEPKSNTSTPQKPTVCTTLIHLLVLDVHALDMIDFKVD